MASATEQFLANEEPELVCCKILKNFTKRETCRLLLSFNRFTNRIKQTLQILTKDLIKSLAGYHQHFKSYPARKEADTQKE